MEFCIIVCMSESRFTFEVLFDDEIEAWDYGPVVRSIYDVFKVFGFDFLESKQNDDVSEGELSLNQIKSIDIYSELLKIMPRLVLHTILSMQHQTPNRLASGMIY